MPYTEETMRSFAGDGSGLPLASSPGTIRIAYGRNMQQFGDLRLPEGPGPHPLIVVFHGGFWRTAYTLENINPFCQALAEAGYAVWNVEYRRIGNWGGGWPGTFQDVAGAVNHLNSLAERYPIDLKSIVLLGHSSGGSLALWAAALTNGKVMTKVTPELKIEFSRPELPHLRGVISLAAITDYERAWAQVIHFRVVDRLLGGTPSRYPERYSATSPMNLLPLGLPQVILHGEQDNNVPFDISQCYALAAQAAGDPVTFIGLPELGHTDMVEIHSPAWPVILASINRLLHDQPC